VVGIKTSLRRVAHDAVAKVVGIKTSLRRVAHDAVAKGVGIKTSLRRVAHEAVDKGVGIKTSLRRVAHDAVAKVVGIKTSLRHVAHDAGVWVSEVVAACGNAAAHSGMRLRKSADSLRAASVGAGRWLLGTIVNCRKAVADASLGLWSSALEVTYLAILELTAAVTALSQFSHITFSSWGIIAVFTSACVLAVAFAGATVACGRLVAWQTNTLETCADGWVDVGECPLDCTAQQVEETCQHMCRSTGGSRSASCSVSNGSIACTSTSDSSSSSVGASIFRARFGALTRMSSAPGCLPFMDKDQQAYFLLRGSSLGLPPCAQQSLVNAVTLPRNFTVPEILELQWSPADLPPTSASSVARTLSKTYSIVDAEPCTPAEGADGGDSQSPRTLWAKGGHGACLGEGARMSNDLEG